MIMMSDGNLTQRFCHRHAFDAARVSQRYLNVEPTGSTCGSVTSSVAVVATAIGDGIAASAEFDMNSAALREQ